MDENILYDSRIESEQYKLNNYQAFRALYEIIDNKGKLPLNQTLYRYVTQGFPGNAENAKPLAEKLRTFSSIWKTSSEESKHAVEEIVGAFFGFWRDEINAEHYANAMKLYRINGVENKHFPVYFNVEKYLDEILGDGTTIAELSDERNAAYYSLAQQWAKDLRQNEKDFYEENA